MVNVLKGQGSGTSVNSSFRNLRVTQLLPTPPLPTTQTRNITAELVVSFCFVLPFQSMFILCQHFVSEKANGKRHHKDANDNKICLAYSISSVAETRDRALNFF